MTLHDLDSMGKLGMTSEDPTKKVYGTHLRVPEIMTKEEFDSLPTWKKNHTYTRLLQCTLLLFLSVNPWWCVCTSAIRCTTIEKIFEKIK